MPHVARRRLHVLALVLLVGGLDLLVGDLDALGHLGVDLLLDQLGANVVLHLVLVEPLLLELLRILLLAALEVLLLELREARVDVLVLNLDVEVAGLLLELRALDEELHGLSAQRLVLLRARLRERTLLLRIAALRLADQLVELVLRDRLVADDGDSVRRHGLLVAAAADEASPANAANRTVIRTVLTS